MPLPTAQDEVALADFTAGEWMGADYALLRLVRGVLDLGEGEQGTVVAESLEVCRPGVLLAGWRGGAGGKYTAHLGETARLSCRGELPTSPCW